MNAKLQTRRLLSVIQAGEYLGCSPWTVRELVWKGRLPCVRVGRLVRVDMRDLDQFIEQEKEQVTP